MIRTAAVYAAFPAALLVAFLAVPVPVPAQDPPPAGQQAQRTHVVRQGETLASIARTYLGSAGAWREIYEVNREVVADPDRIFPGMELTIPRSRAAAVAGTDPDVAVIRGRPDEPLTRVRGVEITGDPPEHVVSPDLPQPRSRRDLLRHQPFAPAAVPDFLGPRTVFHRSGQADARVPTRPSVLLEAAGESFALSPSAFHSAAWLVGPGAEPEAVGRITTFSGHGAVGLSRTTIQLFDLVRIELEESAGVTTGDRLRAFHEVGRIGDGRRIVAPSGILEVERLENGGALARAVAGFDHLELGHRVGLLGDFPLSPGVHASPTDTGLRGSVLAFRDRKEIYLPGDQALLDLGSADGLAVGDELVGLVGDEEGWEGQPVARFQVIAVSDDTSTVQLLSSESPSAVRSGLSVVLDRKMP